MIIQNHINSYREQANLSITMYYDDACVICSTEAHNMKKRQPEKIRLVPVEEGLDELSAAGFSREDAMTYMCMKDSYGNWYTHMDAVRLLYKTSGVKWSPLLFLPVVKQLGNFAYPYVARNRYRIPNWVTKMVYGTAVMQACENGVCKIAPDKR